MRIPKEPKGFTGISGNFHHLERKDLQVQIRTVLKKENLA